jgi:mycofactocin precursor
MEPTETSEPTIVDHDDLVDDELLVEEISIDGMCGVY